MRTPATLAPEVPFGALVMGPKIKSKVFLDKLHSGTFYTIELLVDVFSKNTAGLFSFAG